MSRFVVKVTLLIIVLLLCIGAANCTTKTVEGELNWLYDWDEALGKAAKENKPIMIYFYTETCLGCKKLDSDTYSDESLAAFLNDNFICLKSNTGESGVHTDFGIEFVPMIVFASPEGEEIGTRMVGYRPPDEFYQDALAIFNQWKD